MDLQLRLALLLLLAPALLAASVEVRPHPFLSLPALQKLDALSGTKIESSDDAVAYVREAATQFGISDPSLIPGGLASRIAAAELEATQDPNKLVSDEQVAEAFNFLSDEFHVANPERLTAADILLYRGVKASMLPHLYSPKSVSGSRPLGALIMLDTLIYEGGVMDGVRKAALLDHPPGSLKIDQSRGARAALNKSPNLVAREYQRASLTYFARHFQQRSLRDIQSFVEQLEGIMGLTSGTQL